MNTPQEEGTETSRTAEGSLPAEEIADQLRDFSASARLLSDKRQDFLKKYPQKWVSVYRGETVAHADTIEDLMDEMEKAGIPASNAVIRFIDEKRATMIL